MSSMNIFYEALMDQKFDSWSSQMAGPHLNSSGAPKPSPGNPFRQQGSPIDMPDSRDSPGNSAGRNQRFRRNFYEQRDRQWTPTSPDDGPTSPQAEASHSRSVSQGQPSNERSQPSHPDFWNSQGSDGTYSQPVRLPYPTNGGQTSPWTSSRDPNANKQGSSSPPIPAKPDEYANMPELPRPRVPTKPNQLRYNRAMGEMHGYQQPQPPSEKQQYQTHSREHSYSAQQSQGHSREPSYSGQQPQMHSPLHSFNGQQAQQYPPQHSFDGQQAQQYPPQHSFSGQQFQSPSPQPPFNGQQHQLPSPQPHFNGQQYQSPSPPFNGPPYQSPSPQPPFNGQPYQSPSPQPPFNGQRYQHQPPFHGQQYQPQPPFYGQQYQTQPPYPPLPGQQYHSQPPYPPLPGQQFHAYPPYDQFGAQQSQSYATAYPGEDVDTKNKMPVRPIVMEDRPPAYTESVSHVPEEPREPTPPAPIRPTLDLQGMTELNLLILGETGVGKSTFINAFVNYLKHSSLDEALSAPEPECVIPSSFTWQSLVGDEYIAKNVFVKPNTGDHTDTQSLSHEKDGSTGESETQESKIYRIDVGQVVVRLIDTPGIGDTRGSAQDKKNMDDILNKLRQMKVLHGILILLKPNNARLNVMFKFCLKELLIHLHRDAAKNIVFGFTNARNTSFRPGETYSILKHMLDEDKAIGIQMSRNTSYCFDSESFRCLAAASNGVNIHDMGDIQDYAISWEKSAAETYRLLEHFRPTTTAPHMVESTWSLNQTRNLVRILTKPMADITQNINANIGLLKDEQKNLQDKHDRGDKLKGDLKITKVVYDIKKLDRPRTVCSDADCVEFKDDQKHYKSMCHDPCYLTGVQVEKVQCDELMQCAAFYSSANGECSVCGHRWQVHLHYMWEPVEKKVKVDDEAVAKRIKENANEVVVAQTAIDSRKKRIVQYEKEREKIQQAAGQFSVYLKRSSIKPYNDSKLEYLDHLIEEEKGKVQAGGSAKRLDDLRSDKRQHEQEIQALTQYAQAGGELLDQKGINKLIQELYALKLTGPDLKKVANQMMTIERDNNAIAKAQSEGSRGSVVLNKRLSSMPSVPTNMPIRHSSGGGLLNSIKKLL